MSDLMTRRRLLIGRIVKQARELESIEQSLIQDGRLARPTKVVVHTRRVQVRTRRVMVRAGEKERL